VFVAAETFGIDYESGVFPEILNEFRNALSEMNSALPACKQGAESPEKPLLLADTNYFSKDNLQAVKVSGINVIILNSRYTDEKSRHEIAQRS
jgi:hypothetical protein